MSAHYDVFNGDADGICALHQLRMAHPVPDAETITGVKRDIRLLSKLDKVQDSKVTVLDISLDSNREHLTHLLKQNNSVFYIDHHFAGEIPKDSRLESIIDPSPEVCTSLLVNNFLKGDYPLWAVCGAFGDNLHEQAHKLAATLNVTETEMSELREVGELLNYNGYGSSIEDLHFDPAKLYKKVSPHQSPFTFFHDSTAMKTLREGYASDMGKSMAQEPLFPGEKNRIYQLPDAPWARRISGVFANLRAREQVDSAHALLTRNSDQSWRISIRAPLNNKKNADTLCKSFPTGGGRAAAAGINSLPEDMFDQFLQAFHNTYP